MVARGDPREVAGRILTSRYPEAELAFLAGSVIRGEGTETSDLDLVVVHRKLDHAWRESFRLDGWPIEAFVHDPATLRYFFTEVDAGSGVPSLPRMVLEGLPIPNETDLSRALKSLAREVLSAGPPPLSPKEIELRRYMITDLVDDLRAPRNREEAMASGVKLYPLLSDLHFRGRGRWSASGKSIPRALEEDDPALSAAFSRSFEALFVHGDPAPVTELAERILAHLGGFLFEGLRQDAPDSWRKE